MTQEQLVNWFTHHPATDDETVRKYQTIREAGLWFASVIVGATPTGADQTAAIRKVREAVMTANAAIACEGK
jgi:hypothetical protein